MLSRVERCGRVSCDATARVKRFNSHMRPRIKRYAAARRAMRPPVGSDCGAARVVATAGPSRAARQRTCSPCAGCVPAA
eukprot:4650907-Prymnesium_polylepis.1